MALLPLLLLLPGRAQAVLDPPTGSGDAVIVVSTSPGTGTAESSFTGHPDLVVAGDGTVYRSDERGLETFHIDHDQVLALLGRADVAGLLDHSTSAMTMEGVMDAGSTYVRLDTGRVRRTHDVYALEDRFGYVGLRSFVRSTLDWAGRQPATPYRPTAYRVLIEDETGYHCTVSPTTLPDDEVLAQAALVPGERCSWE